MRASTSGDSAPVSKRTSGPMSSSSPVTITRREERRQATVDEIKALARRQLAENGPGALSMRAIAREMRITPSGLYRYYASHDDLVSALCVDAYGSVADALIAARDARPVDDHAGRWWAICHAYRRWALRNPSDFALIFGTPVPGYHAPESVTGPAAGRFVAVQFDVLAAAVESGAANPDRTPAPDAFDVGPLLRDFLQQGGRESRPQLAVVGLNAWASVLGYLVAEIFGSLRHLIDDTDKLFDAHLRTVMLGMGFDPELTETAARDSS